jgi:hypothetical protein
MPGNKNRETHKFQAPNPKQIPNLNIQISNGRSAIGDFELGNCDLFVVLEFVIWDFPIARI